MWYPYTGHGIACQPSGMENCSNGILEVRLLFLSPTVMFLIEASEAWQFSFPTLCAQSGGKQEMTGMGSPKLPEDFLWLKS